MSFPQLGYPQYLSASQAVYGSERPGVLTPSSRGGSTEIGGSPSATAAAVTSVLGMYASPYAHNYSAFLPYTSADLALFSQMGSQYDLKDSPGVHPASFAAHTSPAFTPMDREQGNVGSRSKEDEDGNLFGSGDEAEKNEDEEEIDLESIDIDKIDENDGDQSNDDDDDKSTEGNRELRGTASVELDTLDKRRAFALQAHEAFDKTKSSILVHPGTKESQDSNNNTRVLSPDRPTATSPDNSSQKPTSPCAPSGPTHPSTPHHQLQTHPAFLSNHGLYTCQIGKFHNWTNGAFLGQNSLLNVRSFLGVNHHHNHHLPSQQQQQQPTSVLVSPVTAAAALSGDRKSPESHSPKHIDHGNAVRPDSPPAQPLKSSFRPLHDRSALSASTRSPADTQRVLTALSSA
ncbi:hypothetical protein WMY93_026814 [Mugilogobius chulae]|uniref:Uncharacterized protein n=1 Tax=Mugilogobius chulae TaxID=88201 RepID=A0AAW0N9N0_9GOBI